MATFEATFSESNVEINATFDEKIDLGKNAYNRGYNDALAKRTDLVVTENGEYTPSEDGTGFKSVSVAVKGKWPQIFDKTVTEIVANDLQGITKISCELFSLCRNLVYAELPEGLVSLSNNVFYYCDAMETVILPSSFEKAAYSVFDNCKKLITVKSKATTPPTIQNNTFYRCTALEKIIVPAGCGDAYKSATNWSAYADKIVEGDV